MEDRGRGMLTFLRGDDEDGERVTYVELFFDLVFAFAITQISGVLGEQPTLLSLLEGLVITCAIWWVWVYTAWATNWLNPDRRLVLWFLLALTAIGLVISQAIPLAFDDRAPVFATAYLIYSFVRTLGVIAGTRRAAPLIAAGQSRILVWSAVSGVFWLLGIFQDEPWLRLAVWAVAIAIEYAGPWSLFWVPGRGKSSWTAWKIRGGHFSERAALFIIIVLGESIIVVGQGLTANKLSVPIAIAATSAFVNAIAMWFLYFAHGQDRGRRFIAARDTSGPVARISYTYLHVILVIGLVLSTHGSELALGHGDEQSDLAFEALMLLGTAVYVAGLFSFKVSIGIRVGWIPSHIGGIAFLSALFVLCGAQVFQPSRLGLALITTGVLILVVAGDEVLWNVRNATRQRARA